jgi:hypothetical protein
MGEFMQIHNLAKVQRQKLTYIMWVQYSCITVYLSIINSALVLRYQYKIHWDVIYKLHLLCARHCSLCVFNYLILATMGLGTIHLYKGKRRNIHMNHWVQISELMLILFILLYIYVFLLLIYHTPIRQVDFIFIIRYMHTV